MIEGLGCFIKLLAPQMQAAFQQPSLRQAAVQRHDEVEFRQGFLKA